MSHHCQGCDQKVENGLINGPEGSSLQMLFCNGKLLIAAEKNKTCNNSLKKTSECVLKLTSNL